jgi:tyrosine-protein kinase Etk/Wzc
MMQPTLENPVLMVPESRFMPPGNASPEMRLLSALIVLAKRKRLIMKVIACGALLGIAAALLLPRKFAATARIMPPQQNQSIASSMLGQLGPLAAMAGRDLGLRNPSDLYIAILHSRTIADALISRFSLMQVYGKSRIEDARKRLDEVSEISAGRESMISIVVHDRDPQRAADIANAYVEELQKVTQTLGVTEAGRRRLFYEQEVQKASGELASAEQALKRVQETTGVIQLDSQSKAMIEGLMTLRAQVMAKEAQVQSMRTFATAENPDLVRAEQELTAMKSEYAGLERGKGGSSLSDVPLEKVPSAGLAYLRRLRELKYRESLLEILTKQYEIARIDEGKEAATIQVLDPAVRPGVEVRTWSFRLAVGMVILGFAFLLAIVLALLAESLAQARNNPEYSTQIQSLKFWLARRGRSSHLA